MSSLVFFGAGASKPFGILTMEEMVSEFEQELGKKDPKIARFYMEIKNILKQKSSVKIDIESMLTVIDGIVKNRTIEDMDHFIFYSAKKMPDNSKFMKFSSDEIKMAEKLKQKLHSYIKDTCALKNSNMTDIYNKTYFPFFKHIPGNKKPFDDDKLTTDWKSYTTNYDNIFETFWREYYIPRDHFQQVGESNLNIFKFDSLASDHTFCKLHGSLDWTGKPNIGKITRKIQSYFNRHGSTGETVMLFPTQQKDLYLDPWFTLLVDLKYGLSEKKYWYVVGYAFNDIFIRKIFEDGIIKKPDKKLVIIDPNAREIKKKFDKSTHDKIDALPIRFDDDDFETKFSDYTSDIKTIILCFRVDQNNAEKKSIKLAVASPNFFKSKNITSYCEPRNINSKFKYVLDEKNYPGYLYEFENNNLSGIRLELKIDCPHNNDITLYLSDNTKNIDFGIWYCNGVIFSSNTIKEKTYETSVANKMTWLKHPITIDKARLYSKTLF